MKFETNVFINCPFDSEYSHLLRAMIFTIVYFNLEPKLSQTTSSSIIRINQIKQHIRDSKFGIHDLSRSKALKKRELPRLNMPYELGLDIGCAEFGSRKLREKKILILETDRYHYQKVLSDIAGQDIENHDDDPKLLVKKLRNWLSTCDNENEYVAANEVWLSYVQFNEDLLSNLTAKRYSLADVSEMPVADFIKFSKDWIRSFNPEGSKLLVSTSINES